MQTMEAEQRHSPRQTETTRSRQEVQKFRVRFGFWLERKGMAALTETLTEDLNRYMYCWADYGKWEAGE